MMTFSSYILGRVMTFPLYILGRTVMTFLLYILGRVKLPERAAMEKDIDRKQQNMDAKYYHSRRHTLQVRPSARPFFSH